MKTVNYGFAFLSMAILVISCTKENSDNPTDDEPVNLYGNYLNYPEFVEDGLVAYFPLDGNCEDLSRNKNEGIINGVTFTANRFNEAETAAHFDGDNDYFEITGIEAYNNEEATICFWVKTDSMPENYNGVIYSRTTAQDTGIVISLSESYFIWFNCYADNATSVTGCGFNNLKKENFGFVAMTYDKNFITIYLNGRQMITGYNYSCDNYQQNIFIGKTLTNSDPYSFFHGEIDDILIYNRVLTSDEIKSLAEYQ